MNQELSKLIRHAREKKGLSQGSLAQELGLSSSQYISNLERNLAPLSVKMIPHLCQLLNLNERIVVEALVARYRRRVWDVVQRERAKLDK